MRGASFSSDNAVLLQYHTSLDGLTDQEAKFRLKLHGKNEISSKRQFVIFHLILSQFKDILLILLIIAAAISFTFGQVKDGVVITVIVVINFCIGFFQEFKAERSLEALQKIISSTCRVIRNGQETSIPRQALVPGDIIILEEGDKVPADAKIIESYNTNADESCLTGESTQVFKQPHGDTRESIVFMGTNIVTGWSKAVVIATGMNTEFGKIATLTLEEKYDLSPLQKELHNMGTFIAKLALGICIFVFIVGHFLQGEPVLQMFFYAISIAVAVVPEGLPTTVTIALAMGVNVMAKKNSIVKKLASVETLGATTVICSDKTGTLTKNEMTVRKLFVNNKFITVSGEGYSSIGKLSDTNVKKYELLLTIGAMCNNASYSKGRIAGDPTEIALHVAAAKAELFKSELEKKYKQEFEIPFSSERKRMTVICRQGKKKFAFVKGSPAEILSVCTHVLINGKCTKLTKSTKERLLAKNRIMAEDSLRVLAAAYKPLTSKSFSENKVESNLIFVGFFGMMDPPKDNVKDAILQCRNAGINVIMITGDQQTTAKAIAKQIGLADDDSQVITGALLHSLSDDQLFERIKTVRIFARTSPSDKLRIINVLKKHNHVIAMTGDGVNDAPALKRADIGISMGITGTDVSKEASHMIITDDSFSTIVTAVEEGRAIYDNIKKFVLYDLTGIIAELLVILFTIVMMLPLPVTAIQILLINLGTEVLPSLALGLDNKDPNIMTHKPRTKDERMLDRKGLLRIFFYAVIAGIGSIGVYLYYLETAGHQMAQTMTFLTLVLFQMFNVFNFRHQTKSVFQIGLFTNKYAVAAVTISIALLLTIIYVPDLSAALHLAYVSFKDWLIVLAVSSSILIIGECWKIKLRKDQELEQMKAMSS